MSLSASVAAQVCELVFPFDIVSISCVVAYRYRHLTRIMIQNDQGAELSRTLAAIAPSLLFNSTSSLLTSSLRIPARHHSHPIRVGYLTYDCHIHNVQKRPAQGNAQDVVETRRTPMHIRPIKILPIRSLTKGIRHGSWYALSFPQSAVRIVNAFLEERDLVIIGGGVAGYVAAIKAGQSGLKVFMSAL